jgi:hypothetical protein
VLQRREGAQPTERFTCAWDAFSASLAIPYPTHQLRQSPD